jgi:uncharacterized protein
MMTRRRASGYAASAFAIALAAVIALGLLVRPAVAPALAQQETSSGLAVNFLNPFPENETWRGLVVGDNLAEGLLGGILDAMASESRLQMQRRHRPLSSLARSDNEEDAKALEDLVVKDKIHIVIIMFGFQDRYGTRAPNGRRLPVGSPEWRAQYSARVDRIVRALRRRGVALYWVGLPIMRRSDWNEDIEAINDVFRERALSNGARYVDAYKQSADENGQFSDRGPDITGKIVRLRDYDGYDFTPAGYRKLAFFLERDLKRDMTMAREERTIPLAGSEAEQKRINPESANLSGAPDATPAGPQAKAAKDARAAASPVTRALTPGATGAATQGGDSPQGDIKAENVRVSFKSIGAGGREEQVTIEVVRPPLSQSVIQLMTRRDTGEKASQVGDTLTDTLSNGLLVMRSVTPSGAGAERAGTRRALTQQPFFIALAKGERLPPKPGRADDFRWPREDDLPPPQAAAASAPIASPVPLQQQGRQRQSRQRNTQPSPPPQSKWPQSPLFGQ